MKRKRRRRNPVPNPDMTDILIGVGLVAIVGGLGYYLYTQSTATAAPALTAAATPGYHIQLPVQGPANVPVGTIVSLLAPGGTLIPSSQWATTKLPTGVTQGVDSNGNLTFTAATAGSYAVLGTYNGTAYSFTLVAS